MKIIFREMAKLLNEGENFVVATVFDQSGSAPRTSGAKMLVRAGGMISGTIGGGRLEADAIQAAQKVLLSGRPMIWSFQLTGEDAASMDMICGGQGQVLLDFIDGTDETTRIIYEEAFAILETKGKGWLITTMGEGQNFCTHRSLIKRDGTLVGRFDGEPQLLSKLTSGTASMSIHVEIIDKWRCLIEPLRNSGTVYIFGAGHVSQQIAPLSETVGFKTVVLDDRAEYANDKRFPSSSKIILLESFDRLPELAFKRSYTGKSPRELCQIRLPNGEPAAQRQFNHRSRPPNPSCRWLLLEFSRSKKRRCQEEHLPLVRYLRR